MTLRKALVLAEIKIKVNEEYIDDLNRYDKENPDTSTDQIGARMYQVVIKMAESENKLLKEIIKEISKK